MIHLYTDGSAKTKKGGWGCLIVEDDVEIECSGTVENTTNNRMEITAVIEGLKLIRDGAVVIFSDSQYVINCAQRKWKRNINLDLWAIYDEIATRFIIEWRWVKAHNGHRENTIADRLSRNYCASGHPARCN